MSREESSPSERTTDHEEIREWVEERDGHPARVEGTGKNGGLLRIEFDERDDLEPCSWDEFFDAFEETDLAMVYQEETASGDESRFAKLVHRADRR